MTWLVVSPPDDSYLSCDNVILAMNRVVFPRQAFPVALDMRSCIPMHIGSGVQELLDATPEFTTIFNMYIDVLGVEHTARLMRDESYIDVMRSLGHEAVHKLLVGNCLA